MQNKRTVLMLDEAQMAEHQRRCPDSESSAACGARAMLIAEHYLLLAYPGARFLNPVAGADITIVKDDVEYSFEVKGTRKSDIDLKTLKVSSLASFQMLQSGAPLLRICGVFTARPVVVVLEYGKDYTLQPEPRWAAKAVREPW